MVTREHFQRGMTFQQYLDQMATNMHEIARFVERPTAVTEYMEKKMLELRRAMREEKKEEWRQAAVDEIRTLLKA